MSGSRWHALIFGSHLFQITCLLSNCFGRPLLLGRQIGDRFGDGLIAFYFLFLRSQVGCRMFKSGLGGRLCGIHLLRRIGRFGPHFGCCRCCINRFRGGRVSIRNLICEFFRVHCLLSQRLCLIGGGLSNRLIQFLTRILQCFGSLALSHRSGLWIRSQCLFGSFCCGRSRRDFGSCFWRRFRCHFLSRFGSFSRLGLSSRIRLAGWRCVHGCIGFCLSEFHRLFQSCFCGIARGFSSRFISIECLLGGFCCGLLGFVQCLGQRIWLACLFCLFGLRSFGGGVSSGLGLLGDFFLLGGCFQFRPFATFSSIGRGVCSVLSLFRLSNLVSEFHCGGSLGLPLSLGLLLHRLVEFILGSFQLSDLVVGRKIVDGLFDGFASIGQFLGLSLTHLCQFLGGLGNLFSNLFCGVGQILSGCLGLFGCFHRRSLGVRGLLIGDLLQIFS